MKRGKRVWNYLRSTKTGKEANHLERMALNDPFLYEALEGLEGLDGEHEQVVGKLCRSLTHSSRGRRSFYWMVAAAVILGGIALSVFLRPATPVPMVMLVRQPEETEEEMPAVIYQDSAKSVYENPVKMKAADCAERTKSSGLAAEERQQARPVRLTSRTDKAISRDSETAAEALGKRLQVEKNEKPMSLLEHTLGIKDAAAVSPGPALSASVRQDTVLTVTRKRQKRREFSLIAQQERLRTDWEGEFRRYISDSLRYPETARDNGVEGEVVLSVHLNKRFRPSRIKVIRKLSPACDREARRLVEEYPGIWNAGERDFTVSVRFSLKDQP